MASRRFHPLSASCTPSPSRSRVLAPQDRVSWWLSQGTWSFSLFQPRDTRVGPVGGADLATGPPQTRGRPPLWKGLPASWKKPLTHPGAHSAQPAAPSGSVTCKQENSGTPPMLTLISSRLVVPKAQGPRLFPQYLSLPVFPEAWMCMSMAPRGTAQEKSFRRGRALTHPWRGAHSWHLLRASYTLPALKTWEGAGAKTEARRRITTFSPTALQVSRTHTVQG